MLFLVVASGEKIKFAKDVRGAWAAKAVEKAIYRAMGREEHRS